jgi:hypothetical protein
MGAQFAQLCRLECTNVAMGLGTPLVAAVLPKASTRSTGTAAKMVLMSLKKNSHVV